MLTRITLTFVVIAALCAGDITLRGAAVAGQSDPAETLKARIEALRPAAVAWRKIQWKSCLLDGLKESREKKKPLLLWVFIDRPTDDARC